MNNYLFFKEDAEIDNPIFRVFSIERLLEIFSSKSLVLVKPSKWDDPFENFILKSRVKFENGELAGIEFGNFIFGQCWSLLNESDAMWRIYSPDKHGVKVKTTPRKLRMTLASNVKNPEISAFIGKVRYESGEYLRNMVTDRVRMQNKIFDTTGRGHAETLLFKREEFSHEQEVRVVYSGREEDAKKEIFPVKIDPFLLIEEIVFDPRMDKNLVLIYQKHFSNIGFTGLISRSQLYDVPDLVVSV
jgi:Protein of unknown function (DUF2971)